MERSLVLPLSAFLLEYSPVKLTYPLWNAWLFSLGRLSFLQNELEQALVGVMDDTVNNIQRWYWWQGMDDKVNNIQRWLVLCMSR